MLGTTIFDEAESSRTIDFRVEHLNNNSNNNCELAHSNDTSFISSCQRFQVVSWSENNNKNVAKIAFFDRTYGSRPSRLVRFTANFPLAGLAVSEVASTIFGQQQQQQNNNNNTPPALEIGVFLCSNNNNDNTSTRVHFIRLVVSFDQDEIIIHKAKQTVSNQLTPENDDDNSNNNDNNENSSSSSSFVSAFGLCSSFNPANVDPRNEESSYVTVAVAKSNGLVVLVNINPVNGEDIDQVWFSVDDYWKHSQIMNWRKMKAEQQQQNNNNNGRRSTSVQQQEQQNGIGKIFSWFSGGNNNNNSGSNHHQDPASTIDEQEIEFLNRRAINYVTSLSFCPATNRLFLCCSCGMMMYFIPDDSSHPELVPLPPHLQVRQALSATASSSANAVRFSTVPTAGDDEDQVANNNNNNTSILYIVADDISGSENGDGAAAARYLMALESNSLQTTAHWSAPAGSSHSRCVRIETPRSGEGLDICYAVWQIPENGVSILWSPSFGVAYVSMPLLTFFLDTADENFPMNVITPGGKVMSIREAPRMTALEKSVASLAVASRPALNDATAVLLPSTHQGVGGKASLLAHPVGGSDLVDVDTSLPVAIKAGISILNTTQMWREFDSTLAQLLSDPDASSNVATLTRFVDMIALSSSLNDDDNNDNHDSTTFEQMQEATSYLMNPENLVNLSAYSTVRSRRWISDRLSQSLFSATCGLLLARIAWSCSSSSSSFASSDYDENTVSSTFQLQQQVNQASMLLTSAYHVVSSLGAQCTLLINSQARNENDNDVVMIGKCLGVLLKGNAIVAANNEDESEESNNNNNAAFTMMTQRAITMVAHRLLKAAQDYGRSKPLAVWISYWQKEFPIVCHFAAVLIAAHHTQDARPGVGSMLFAQHLHSTCAALTSAFEMNEDGTSYATSVDNSNRTSSDAFGMMNANDDGAPTGNHYSQVQDKNTMCSTMAKTIFDLLQGTTASLDLLEVTALLQQSEYPIFEACRLYRSAMLLLFMNGGGSATFLCEPDLVESLLCDVKQIYNLTIEAQLPQLDRVFGYLLVESSLFLASVDVHRRQFFSALQHLSTVCRNDGSRKTSVDELVSVIVQNVLDDREAQQQLVKAGINDEPLLRAVNDAIVESIMQPSAPGVAREERDAARVQHTVFFVQFLAARGALGSAARVAHDVASRMRSFQRCNVFTLRGAASLIALALAICRSIPDVEPPMIVAGFGTGTTGGSRSSGGGSRAGELTGMGGNDLEAQGSFFADTHGMMGAQSKTMVFSPQKRAATRPLSRQHVPELQRRLLWILSEAKLASRAPVQRPSWPDKLEEGLITSTETPNGEALISTIRELLHLRMWDDALRLSEAYPEILHPGSVFQVRIHDMLSSDLWNTTSGSSSSSSSNSNSHNTSSKLSIQDESPLVITTSSSSGVVSSSSSSNEEPEDAQTNERRLFLTEQWHKLVQDINSHPTRRNELLRSAIEQILAHQNGDYVPRFVYDALGDVDPATLLELCLNCTRLSFRVTDIAFDIVMNFFEKKKYSHDSSIVLPVTLLERLVLGARKVMNDPRLSSHVPKFILEKAPKVDQLVTRHFKGGQN